jgi:hypothetical protein
MPVALFHAPLRTHPGRLGPAVVPLPATSCLGPPQYEERLVIAGVQKPAQ